MAVYYIEPKPGNDKGFLRDTVNALVKEKYQVEVIGHGYPPIYVEADETQHGGFEKLRQDLETLVEEIDNGTKVLPSPCHRMNYEDDFKNLEILTNPQPHEAPEVPINDIAEPTTPAPTNGNGQNSVKPESEEKQTTPNEGDKTTKILNSKQLAAILGNPVRFSEEDLRTICQNLPEPIDYDETLPGEKQKQKAENLIKFCQTNESFDKLKEVAFKLKPRAFDDLIG